MSKILVPPEVLLSVSEQFNRASNQLEANSNTLNQHIQMLASCWDGTTCSRFYYDFQQAYRDMKLTIEHMQVTSQELKKIAYKFMQVDNEQGNLDPRCASPQTLNSLGMSNVHYEKAIKEKSFGDHVNELGMEFKAFGVGVQAAAAEMWDSAKDTANALIEEPIETGKQMAYDATIGTAEEIVKTTIWGAKMALDIGDTREKFGEEIQVEQELINEMGTSTYLGQQAAMIFGGFALKRLGVKDTPNLKKDSGGDGGKGKAAEGTGEGLDLYRRTANVGEFSHLEVPMQLREVKRLAEQAGIGLDGVKIKIIRDPDMIRLPHAGWANPNGKEIQLYPNAFMNEEQLVKTLAHERTHIFQVRLYGEAKDIPMLDKFEEGAYGVENTFWDYFNRKGK